MSRKNRNLHLLRYLYRETDEDHPATTDMLLNALVERALRSTVILSQTTLRSLSPSLYITEGKGRDENNDADNGLDTLNDCSAIATAFTRLPAAQPQSPVLFPPSTSPQRAPRTGHGYS